MRARQFGFVLCVAAGSLGGDVATAFDMASMDNFGIVPEDPCRKMGALCAVVDASAARRLSHAHLRPGYRQSPFGAPEGSSRATQISPIPLCGQPCEDTCVGIGCICEDGVCVPADGIILRE